MGRTEKEKKKERKEKERERERENLHPFHAMHCHCPRWVSKGKKGTIRAEHSTCNDPVLDPRTRLVVVVGDCRITQVLECERGGMVRLGRVEERRVECNT